jgi:asparagine synthase (glutamine-hydrolysing)
MCGLCGEVTFDGRPADAIAVGRMADILTPRGPDSFGAVARGRWAFGHRRLKIFDLSDRAEQPMIDPELGLSMVFNGCIYNHEELRRELEARGYHFFSTSDTEVVLKAYHAWGLKFVERFVGMFAIALYERDSGRLVLARDRLGIKPLYISETPGRLRFASTLPALLAAGNVDTSIDPVAFQYYMTFHAVVPAPHTMLNGVRKLPPATVRVVEADGRSREMVYWTVSYERSAQDIAKTSAEWREEVTSSLKLAVQRRSLADVPVGVLLSGGVDSSLIVGLLAEQGQPGLKTFSIGFEAANGEQGDEFVYSDLIARHYGTEHTRIFIESQPLLHTLPSVIGAMSEPMVSYDNVGFYLLSKEVSKHVTVVQSGQGADEVFAGYHWYQKLAQSNNAAGDYAKAFFDRDYATFVSQVHPEHAGTDTAASMVRAHFDMPGASDPVDQALRLDSTVMLVDDPVKRVDNMTMAWGLEARVPFLDHELVELAARIPAVEKLRDGGKGILKDVARQIIPSEVIDRPKGYFPVPALKYLDGPYLSMARDALKSDKARMRGLFREDYIDDLLANPRERMTPLQGSELWQAATLELWFESQGI